MENYHKKLLNYFLNFVYYLCLLLQRPLDWILGVQHNIFFYLYSKTFLRLVRKGLVLFLTKSLSVTIQRGNTVSVSQSKFNRQLVTDLLSYENNVYIDCNGIKIIIIWYNRTIFLFVHSKRTSGIYLIIYINCQRITQADLLCNITKNFL